MRTSDGAIVETINPVYDEHLEWRRHYFYVTWSPSGRKLLLRDGTSGANALQPAVFSLDNKTMDLAPGGKGRNHRRKTISGTRRHAKSRGADILPVVGAMSHDRGRSYTSQDECTSPISMVKD